MSKITLFVDHHATSGFYLLPIRSKSFEYLFQFMTNCFHNWVQQLRKLFVLIRFCKVELELKIPLISIILKISTQDSKFYVLIVLPSMEPFYERFEKER